MNSTVSKGVSVMLAVIMAAAVIPFFMDSADANPGDTEADPLVWWNNTIILLPEVVVKLKEVDFRRGTANARITVLMLLVDIFLL